MAHDVYNLISLIAESENVRLTDAAREMLALPVIEQFPNDKDMNRNTVGSSIRSIIVAVKLEEPRPHGEMILNARAIIHGFSLRYCNIPPFCGR